MSSILRNIQIPLFIRVEAGSLKKMRELLDAHHLSFQKPLIISEDHILQQGGNDVVNALGDPATILTSKNTIEEGERIAQIIRDGGNDVIFSIGGGRIVDLGKYAASKAGVNYISIPTSPSNDGICSPVAVMEDETGKTQSLGVNMPVGIVVDTTILVTAPEKNIRSGIGELISNFSSIEDWKLADREGKESIDDFAASIATSAAELIYETCRGVDIDLRDESFLEKLTNGLILSGIAMNVAGSSRPCSGGEHEISHAIDALFPGTELHGLQVAYGTLLCHFLREQPIDHLVDFFARVGLPVRHAEIGLTDEQMVEVLALAPTTRPNRFTILEKIGINADNAADHLKRYNDHLATLTQ